MLVSNSGIAVMICATLVNTQTHTEKMKVMTMLLMIVMTDDTMMMMTVMMN